MVRFYLEGFFRQNFQCHSGRFLHNGNGIAGIGKGGQNAADNERQQNSL